MEFLERYSHGGIGSIEMLGVALDGSVFFKEVTLQYREEGLPPNLVAVENRDGFKSREVFQTSIFDLRVREQPDEQGFKLLKFDRFQLTFLASFRTSVLASYGLHSQRYYQWIKTCLEISLRSPDGLRFVGVSTSPTHTPSARPKSRGFPGYSKCPNEVPSRTGSGSILEPTQKLASVVRRS